MHFPYKVPASLKNNSPPSTDIMFTLLMFTVNGATFPVWTAVSV